MTNLRLMRLPEVKEKTGLSTSTIWRLEKMGLFPRRINISLRAVGWLENEIEIINLARSKAKSEDEIRELINNMTVSRKKKADIWVGQRFYEYYLEDKI